MFAIAPTLYTVAVILLVTAARLWQIKANPSAAISGVANMEINVGLVLRTIANNKPCDLRTEQRRRRDADRFELEKLNARLDADYKKTETFFGAPLKMHAA